MNYTYVVVGDPADVQRAIEGIDTSMKKYVFEEDTFPRLNNDQFNKYVNQRDQIQRDAGVFFRSEKDKITYLGKAAKI